MEEREIRAALNQHWAASASGDQNTEHEIYADDAVCDYPQSGERILGRSNLQALRSHQPGKPAGFETRRLFGSGDLWITEYTIAYLGTAQLHGEHYGIQERQGSPRNTVFCRPL